MGLQCLPSLDSNKYYLQRKGSSTCPIALLNHPRWIWIRVCNLIKVKHLSFTPTPKFDVVSHNVNISSLECWGYIACSCRVVVVIGIHMNKVIIICFRKDGSWDIPYGLCESKVLNWNREQGKEWRWSFHSKYCSCTIHLRMCVFLCIIISSSIKLQ